MTDIHAYVAAKVADTFAAELCCPPALVRPESELASLPGLDSLKLLRVIAALEAQCDVGLDDELLYDLKIVSDLTALVESELSLLSSPSGQP